MTNVGNQYQCYISMWTVEIAASLALSEAAVKRPQTPVDCAMLPDGAT